MAEIFPNVIKSVIQISKQFNKHHTHKKKKSEENYIKPHLNQMFKINEKENEFKAARKRTQFF